MKNRKPIIILILLIVAVIVFSIVSNILQDKPLLFGDMWRDTPEEAFEYAMNNIPAHHVEEAKDTYKTRTLIDIMKYDNDWYYLYISEANTFTVTQCSYDSDKDKWACVYAVGYQYDKDIELVAFEGSMFDLWECDDISYFYDIGKEHNAVFAFLETGVAVDFFFNDIKTNVRTYTFEENGKTYSIDCFYINEFPKDIEKKDVYLEYTYYTDQNCDTKPFTEVTLPSGSSRGSSVKVQVLLPAPTKKTVLQRSFFYFS